ncbi:MAG: hypothetical protein DDT30_02069 [Dehalococcoidia bacterium]|nr:hypothetical protein [Bacillota bacterium]
MATLESLAQIGEGFSFRIPRAIAERIGLTEGSKVTMSVEGRKLLLQPAEDAIELALKGKKFASLSPEEVEK